MEVSSQSTSNLQAWVPLGLSEYRAVWDRCLAAFNFRPSTNPSSFPGIDVPSPSLTFSLPRVGAQKRLPADTDVRDLEVAALAAFRACSRPQERIYALDWQHESYWFQPHASFEEWQVPTVPDGDYCVFLAADLTWGYFGHPWEWTICVFGMPLLAALKRRPPRLFSTIIRQH